MYIPRKLTTFVFLGLFLASFCVDAVARNRMSYRTGQGANLSNVYMIDNFADGDMTETREWFSFGNVSAVVVPSQGKESYLTKYALRLSGKAQQWYVGGVGQYLGIEAGHYTHLKLVIRGNGLNSGYLRIELFDDDNRNTKIDLSQETGMPNADDKFVHSILVDWEGWRVVTVPISQFGDSNPGVGDDSFNPIQLAGSAGLLQFQIIVTTAKDPVGNAELLVDQIKFVKM